MKFVLAPDSFKESMTAKEVCQAMEKGIKKVFPDARCEYVPMADGGEGTTTSLVDATNGTLHEVMVHGPLGEKVKACFGVLGNQKTAVIEVAEACGLHLVKRNKRNPLITTTYGVGELILAALELDITKIIIGLGGSSTNDGGVGMLQALGVKFTDEYGQNLTFGGGSLQQLKTIDISQLDSRFTKIDIEVACDVSNPLTGLNGASYIYGPQKGATQQMVQTLDKGLKHYAQVVEKQLKIDVDHYPGAGAAGGLGAALIGFGHAKLRKGIDIVVEYSELESKMADATYVLTGEGSLDHQTQYGKTPVGVSLIAQKSNIPVIAFAGKVGDDIEALYDLGMTAVIGILPSVVTLEEALEEGSKNV
ncbi:MAG: glycerate kinase family protein, partial [Turicibacter sp.]